MSRLIDADALAETLGITDMSCERCGWYDRTKSLCRRGGDFEDACAAIEDAPTVEERKVGKWISMCNGKPVKVIKGIPQESCACSVCGEWLTASDEYDAFGNYCPNCGAKMEES